MQRKRQFIKDLRKDDIVNDVFVVKFKKPVEQYKNGYKFELRLADSSKEIMYKYWGSQDEAKVRRLYESIEKDDAVLCQGRVNEWNNALEISAGEQHQVKVLGPGEFDIRDFIRNSKRDKEQMWQELLSIISGIQDSNIKAILEKIFLNQQFSQRFKESPAAMYIHHGWLSGLLEHTLEVAKICGLLCTMHPKLNRDLTMGGALLHDIGKIDEFTVNTSIDVSNEGVLVGHINIGIGMLNRVMDELKTPDELRMKLVHIMLTHMGEYGSAKKPAFPEALLVYHADHMNGDMVHMINLMEESSTEDDYIYNKDFGNIYLK